MTKKQKQRKSALALFYRKQSLKYINSPFPVPHLVPLLSLTISLLFPGRNSIFRGILRDIMLLAKHLNTLRPIGMSPLKKKHTMVSLPWVTQYLSPVGKGFIDTPGTPIGLSGTPVIPIGTHRPNGLFGASMVITRKDNLFFVSAPANGNCHLSPPPKRITI